jgi:peptidoglycan/xylan/chitin deacetylase (PgdA/CDA1 family)
MRRPLHHTLIFHRVRRERDPMSPAEPTADWFRDLIAMLARDFQPIALADAVQRAESRSLRGGSVSVTFDDGYADNFSVALPILQEYQVPATFFVASGFLDGGRMWNDSIIETIRRLPPGTHDLSFADLDPVELTDWPSRRRAAQTLITAWKHLPPAERQANVDALSARADGLPQDLMMSSAQLRELASAKDVTIGGHTRSHPILASLDLNQARAEISRGKSDLEDILQQELKLFAYPNGRHGRDFGDEHPVLVREAGFRAAVATDWGTLSASTDHYRIPRFTPWNANLARFSIDLARCHYGML